MSVFYRFQDSGLDDWNKAKNYVQMGFRPGFAVQARELTQMQTIMQAQMTALARRFMISGSVLDAPVSSINTGSGLWSAEIGRGYFYIEPDNKDLGYFVYNTEVLGLSSIEVEEGVETAVYITWQEVQVNPDGEAIPPTNGYAGVEVDVSLKDNAQGYSNYSAPGASRYKIDIVSAGWYRSDQTSLPANSAIVFHWPNGTGSPKYYDGGGSVPQG